jgi:protein-disulfide isomerase
MKKKLDLVITATLVICALIMTGLVVRREFMTPIAAPAQAERKPVMVPRWQEDFGKGVRLGPEQAPVQVIEFADFECPFCGSFHKTLQSVKEHYPREIALTYIHLPIPGHRFAIPAARVAECANDQGRFEAMYDQLFERQDQCGLKPWDEYATTAGLPDIPAFDACIKKTDPIPRVEEGKALGAKLDVQGTPTVIINGWMLGHPPSEEELDSMVKKILAGKSPVDGKS